MALSLGRAGSRISGVAARAVLAGSHAAKGGAGRQIPIAGVSALLPTPSSPLRPKSSALFAQARPSHSRAARTLVMVVVHDDPELGRVYAESLSKAVSNQMAILDKVHRPHGSDVKVESNEVNPDADVKLDLPDQCPEKQPQVVSFVIDGKLCGFTESEMDTLFDHKMRTAISGHKDDPCVAAIEQMGKNMDLALYGVKWHQQACFEKLESRSMGHSFLLEDLCYAGRRRNYVDSFLHETGKKIFPRKVILAKRSLLTLLPYASRYYFYCLFAYSLLTSDIPLCLFDYGLIVLGAQWLASDELKEKLQDYYKYYKNGGKKEAAKDAGQKKV